MFAGLCALLLTGCISRQQSSGFGSAITEGIVSTALAPSLAISVAAQKFQQKNGKWPKNLPELFF